MFDVPFTPFGMLNMFVEFWPELVIVMNCVHRAPQVFLIASIRSFSNLFSCTQHNTFMAFAKVSATLVSSDTKNRAVSFTSTLRAIESTVVTSTLGILWLDNHCFAIDRPKFAYKQPTKMPTKSDNNLNTFPLCFGWATIFFFLNFKEKQKSNKFTANSYRLFNLKNIFHLFRIGRWFECELLHNSIWITNILHLCLIKIDNWCHTFY